MSNDLEKFWKKAKAYGERMGLGADAEDFAQEALLKFIEVGPVKLEWLYLNYRDYHRAQKRVLSSPCGQLSGFRTVSLDAPVDSSDEDSAKLGDLIGVSGPDMEAIGELAWLEEVIRLILRKVKNEEAKRWATETYLKFIEDNL